MIQGHECDAAAITGVRLELTLQHTLDAAFASMLSVNGRCFTLDKRADGYVSSEGVCASVVQAPSKNRASLAFTFVRGAVRCDGRSASLTAPNGAAQAAMIATAQAEVRDLSCLELHGTGTALGDTTETSSLAKVLAIIDEGFVTAGGAKANFGHTMAASGLVGVSKLLLRLEL